ncbi:MAG: SDR family NAD(P)-dependent oxidoreductase [Planctomycetota bacterium]
MVELSGKVIAITGASSGIGLATAIECAKAGMSVSLMARDPEKLTRAEAKVAALGVETFSMAGDVSDRGVCEEYIGETEKNLGSLYSVFANAGYGHEIDSHAMPEDDLRRMFEVNFFGSMHVIGAALPGMLERGAGHLLLCSSCVSKIGLPMYGAYCATKAAQDHMGRAMRVELRSKGVAVSTVHPIGTRTEFFERMGERNAGGLKLTDTRRSAFMQPAEKVARAIVRRLRRGRGGEVWTSRLVRTGLGLAVLAPGLVDRALARTYAKRMSERAG